jgi:arsenate reductase
MAEAFARSYGNDVMEPSSAGLAPAFAIPAVTLKVMSERGLDLVTHYPKPYRPEMSTQFDIVVNMSGEELPAAPKARDWHVVDPMGESEDFHRLTRDDIEKRVMDLILELRRTPPESHKPHSRTHPKLLRG